MNYKGFIGTMEADEKENMIYGRVINLTRDTITFAGRTVEEAKEDFRQAVDDYLAWAEKEGFEPEKPYRGEFVVRSNPELHRAVSMASAVLHVSMSQFATQALRSYVEQLVRQGILSEEFQPQRSEQEPEHENV